jgi:hypothetical protein
VLYTSTSFQAELVVVDSGGGSSVAQRVAPFVTSEHPVRVLSKIDGQPPPPHPRVHARSSLADAAPAALPSPPLLAADSFPAAAEAGGESRSTSCHSRSSTAATVVGGFAAGAEGSGVPATPAGAPAGAGSAASAAAAASSAARRSAAEASAAAALGRLALEGTVGGADWLAAAKLCDDAAEHLRDLQRRAWLEQAATTMAARGGASTEVAEAGSAVAAGVAATGAGAAAASVALREQSGLKRGHALVDACWRKLRRLGAAVGALAVLVDEAGGDFETGDHAR